MNLEEIRGFCDRHSIPYRIHVERPDGSIRATRDNDRKGVVLNRVRQFLASGEILPATIYSHEVVSDEPLPANPTEDDRLHYGQYDKKNAAMIDLLRGLTNGRFKNGAVARVVARDFWDRGIAPTFAEFAAAWMGAVDQDQLSSPEWAYLTDLARGQAGPDWKDLRKEKAERVLSMLAEMGL